MGEPESSATSSVSDGLAGAVGGYKAIFQQIKADEAKAAGQPAPDPNRPAIGKLVFSERIMRPLSAVPFSIAGRFSEHPERWELADSEKVALGDLYSLYLQECVSVDPRAALPYVVAFATSVALLPRALQEIDDWAERRKRKRDQESHGKTAKAGA